MRSEIYSLIPYIWGGTPSAFGSSPRGGAKGRTKQQFAYVLTQTDKQEPFYHTPWENPPFGYDFTKNLLGRNDQLEGRNSQNFVTDTKTSKKGKIRVYNQGRLC